MLYSAALLGVLLASSDAFILKSSRMAPKTTVMSSEPWFPSGVSTVNIDINSLKYSASFFIHTAD